MHNIANSYFFFIGPFGILAHVALYLFSNRKGYQRKKKNNMIRQGYNLHSKRSFRETPFDKLKDHGQWEDQTTDLDKGNPNRQPIIL